MKRILQAVLLAGAGIAPATAAAPIDAEAIAARNLPAVLLIHGTREDSGAEVQGSGCCIHPEGYVLATAHQADGVRDFTGRLADGSTVDLTLVESRPDIEYALFKASKPLPVHAVLGDAMTLKSGAPLVSIASPVGLEFSTVGGNVSNPDKRYGGYPVLLVTLTATHGSSGGPVFDRDGRLVGLISGGLTEADFTIVNKINNAFPLLARFGIETPAMKVRAESEPALVAAPGSSDEELRATDAYNKGVSATTYLEKIAFYSQAISLLPAFYEAHFNLAVAEAAEGNLETAAQHYLAADRLRPASVQVKRNLGRLYLRARQFDDAIAIFTEVLRLAPEEPQSHNDAGEACRRAGKTSDALAHFKRSLALKPDSPGAHYNLALTYANSGQSDEAINHFEAYLAHAPGANDTAEVQAWITKLKSH